MKHILLTALRYSFRQLLSRLKMITFLHFTVFFPGICYCGNCKIRSKVTKIQTCTEVTLFFAGYFSSFDKKMEVNKPQLTWRWMTISLISVDNPFQNMLLHFTEFQERSKSVLRCLIHFQLQQEKSFQSHQHSLTPLCNEEASIFSAVVTLSLF